MAVPHIPASATFERKQVSVWDPLIRISHWTLVAAFTAAYLTAEEESGAPDAVHVWSGYIIGAVLLFRIVWGFVGPRHARFGDFVRGPRAVFGYLIDMARGRARRYLGHSPAGGAMILALLLCLAGTVVTGLIAYGERGLGPLAATGVAAAADRGGVVATARADNDNGDEKNGENESAIGELHGTLANITLVLIAFHVLGVIVASLVHRENLVTAMITGKKRAP